MGMKLPSASTTKDGIVLNTAQTLAGTKTFTAAVIMSGGSALIRQDTTDGADNAALSLFGGGAASSTRGGQINIYGNEHSTNPAAVGVNYGNSISGATVAFKVADSGDANILSGTADGAWTLGRSTGGALTHTIQSGSDTTLNLAATTSSSVLILTSADTSSTVSEVLFRSAASIRWRLVTGQSSTLFGLAADQFGLYNDALGMAPFKITNAGLCTIGPTAGAVAHILRGSLGFGNGSGTGTPVYGMNRSGTNSLDLYVNSTLAQTINSSAVATFSQQVQLTGGFSSAGVQNAALASLNQANTAIVDFRNSNATADANTKVMILGLVGASNMTNAIFIDFIDADGAGAKIGSIAVASATTVAFNTSSDERLKTDITDFTGALAILDNVQPRNYKWIKDNHQDYGFVAQELYEAYPHAVQVGGENVIENPWGIDYGKLTPLLAAAIKELKAQNDALEARVAALEV